MLIRASDGETCTLALAPRSVAEFYRELMATLEAMRLPVKSHPLSVELPEPIRLDRDTQHHAYDREYVDRLRRAAPEPAGLKDARVQPDAAYYHRELNEFILPYDAVRKADSPDDVIRAFIDSTYDRAANLAKWDRGALDRVMG